MCISSNWLWIVDGRHAGRFLGQPTVGRQLTAPWYLELWRAIYHCPEGPSFSPLFPYTVYFWLLCPFSCVILPNYAFGCLLNCSTSKDGRHLSLGLSLSGSAFLAYHVIVNLTFDPEALREEMSSCCLFSVAAPFWMPSACQLAAIKKGRHEHPSGREGVTFAKWEKSHRSLERK